MSANGAILRLAWRDTRRVPVRAVLVLLLVAIPVCAAYIALTAYTSANPPVSDVVRSAFGRPGSDLLRVPLSASASADPAKEARRLTTGGPYAVYRSAYTSAPFTAGPVTKDINVEFYEYVNADPSVLPWRIVEGRAPTGENEVAVDRATLQSLNAGIGSVLTSSQFPSPPQVVTGIASSLDDLPVAITPHLLTDANSTQFLGTTTKWVDAEAVLTGSFSSLSGLGPSNWLGTLGIAVAMVLVLAVVGLIIAAAFSVGSERRVRAFGLMTANGVTPRQAGNVVFLSAMIAAVAGVAFGFGVGALIAPPLIENHTSFVPAGGRLITPDLVQLAVLVFAAIVAASVAARQPAARVRKRPPLQSLSGRVGETPLKRATPILGGVLLCSAVVLTALHAHLSSGFSALAAVAALIATVLLARSLVSLFAAIGRRTGGALAVGLRAAGRNRSRSASIAGAIAVITLVAAVVATLVSLGRVDNDTSYQAAYPTYGPESLLGSNTTVLADGSAVVVAEAYLPQPPTNDVAEARAALPGATETTSWLVQTPGRAPGSVVRFYVVPPEVIAAFGHEKGVSDFEAGHALALSPATLMHPVPTTVEGTGAGGVPYSVPVVEPPFDLTEMVPFGTLYSDALVVTPETARTLGFDPTTGRVPLLQTAPSSVPLPTSEPALLGSAQVFTQPGSTKSATVAALVATKAGPASVQAKRDAAAARKYEAAWQARRAVLARRQEWLILAIAALLALAITAVGTALTMVDAKRSSAVLSAVGASPGMRRIANAAIAAVQALPGALVGVTVGTVVAYLGSRHLEGVAALPWAFLIGMLVAVPLVAAGGTALLTRRRVALPVRID